MYLGAAVVGRRVARISLNRLRILNECAFEWIQLCPQFAEAIEQFGGVFSMLESGKVIRGGLLVPPKDTVKLSAVVVRIRREWRQFDRLVEVRQRSQQIQF